MRPFLKGALQRQVPKHPHKPSSQGLGARTIWTNHWRKPASVERAERAATRQTGTMTPGPMTGGTLRINGGPLIPVTISYSPLPNARGLAQVKGLRHYAPGPSHRIYTPRRP